MNTLRYAMLNLARKISCAAALACAATGAPAQTVSALEVANALARNSVIASRSADMVDSNEAARRLAQAQQERQQGSLPRPGERTGGAGAGAVNHRYWRRQEKLRRVVEQALHRSNETHHARATHRSHKARRSVRATEAPSAVRRLEPRGAAVARQ